MGLLDAPGLPYGQADVWSVVGSRPHPIGRSATTTKAAAIGDTARLSEVAPFDLVALRLVYGNFQNISLSAEFPGYVPIRVKAAVHKSGALAPGRDIADPVRTVRFGGREFATVDGRGLVFSDPIPVNIAAGERYWHETYVDCLIGTPPAAPTLAVAAGGILAVQTWYVMVTYVYPDGTESQPSLEASVATTSGNQSITVTSPAASGNAIGYRVYLANGSGVVGYENPVFGMQLIGANTTVTGSSTQNALSRLVRRGGSSASIGWPIGSGLFQNVGENYIAGRDNTDEPLQWTGNSTISGVFSPMAILGIAKDGRRHASYAIDGDSIQAGTNDLGLIGSAGAVFGGAGWRAVARQTASGPWDGTKTPHAGMVVTARGGDTLALSNTPAGGWKRRTLAELCTHVVDNIGTNDLGNGSAVIYAALRTKIAHYAGRKKFIRLTLDPKAQATTDGYKTQAGQSYISTDAEADRRAINNSLRTTTGSTTVTSEALFRSPGTATPATVLTGGDGTATKFFTGHPFVTGSEAIQVNGTTQAVTTNYAYLRTAVYAGVTYASGITFTTAPANGATVTASYTKAPSLGGVDGVTQVIDTAAAVSDGTGNWWKPGTSMATGTVTASTGSLLTDSSKAWTVDAFRGMSVTITADATTPASVGQVVDISANTATALTLATAWTTVPSVGAAYEVLDAYTVDGLHSSTKGHLAKAAVIEAALFG